MKKHLLIIFLLTCVLGCGKSGSERAALIRDRVIRENAGKPNASLTENAPVIEPEKVAREDFVADNIVGMSRKNGVTTIPVEVNGMVFDFIFDTGASDMTLSILEARFLYKNGLIDESDLGEEVHYQTASGNTATGLQLNLRSVKIGNKQLTNVGATIIDNPDAPLLLGQSALSRFGTVLVDYPNSRIIFK